MKKWILLTLIALFLISMLIFKFWVSNTDSYDKVLFVEVHKINEFPTSNNFITWKDKLLYKIENRDSINRLLRKLNNKNPLFWGRVKFKSSYELKLYFKDSIRNYSISNNLVRNEKQAYKTFENIELYLSSKSSASCSK